MGVSVNTYKNSGCLVEVRTTLSITRSLGWNCESHRERSSGNCVSGKMGIISKVNQVIEGDARGR